LNTAYNSAASAPSQEKLEENSEMVNKDEGIEMEFQNSELKW